MQYEGQALGAHGLARNADGSGQSAAERIERVSVLGYACARGVDRPYAPELRNQAETIERFCARKGWEVVALVREVEPPGSRACGRPSLTHALRQLSRGDANCLMVAELRRLCRSVAELGGILDALDQAGARLVSLDPPIDTGTRFGPAAVAVLVSVSAWERDRRVQMTSAARAKVVVPLRIQPELKRRIERMRSAGMTLQAIASELNQEGVPTVRGGMEWRPSSVQAALGYKRPR